MTDPSAPSTKPPVGRLALLTLAVLIGLSLFFLFARRAAVVVHPADTEVSQ
jgi:hypothetical protein